MKQLSHLVYSLDFFVWDSLMTNITYGGILLGEYFSTPSMCVYFNTWLYRSVSNDRR